LKTLAPRAENHCFGCGAANARGMLLTFGQDDQRRRIVGRFRLGREYEGGPGFLHGGIIATLMDEAMGKVNRFREVKAVTAELNVEYHRPVPVDTEIVVEAFEAAHQGRSLHHQCEIRDAAGKLLARGKGRFVVVDPEAYRKKPGGPAGQS
jgi:uncharacterized protein (TIGR00369 family)